MAAPRCPRDRPGRPGGRRLARRDGRARSRAGTAGGGSRGDADRGARGDRRHGRRLEPPAAPAHRPARSRRPGPGSPAGHDDVPQRDRFRRALRSRRRGRRPGVDRQLPRPPGPEADRSLRSGDVSRPDGGDGPPRHRRRARRGQWRARRSRGGRDTADRGRDRGRPAVRAAPGARPRRRSRRVPVRTPATARSDRPRATTRSWSNGTSCRRSSARRWEAREATAGRPVTSAARTYTIAAAIFPAVLRLGLRVPQGSRSALPSQAPRSAVEQAGPQRPCCPPRSAVDTTARNIWRP